ncbi:GntR family transcriptional regulator [Alteribacillus sp. YIM 98480]|uniref:GntR family transcriptional regulator n=1 Tax=Alteribacillus sp. YIM 98480 TaxID=2606599 RepID=UPI00131AAEE0|nr:GntR family transcriptional regulator [Alteribacillus sp. YIM 98480]
MLNTEKKGFTPIYIQIAQNIRKMILLGHYEQGDKIPTEDEIGNDYGVSRMTARQAVTELVNEGLVYRVHGKGAFVGRRKLERSLNKITGFHQDIKEMGLHPTAKIVSFNKRKPTEKECNSLNIRKINQVFAVKRIRYVDGVPYGLQNLVVPVYLVPDFNKVDLEKESLYSYLKEINKPLAYAEQRMEAVMDENVAKTIDIPETIPFFFFERVSYLEDQTPVEMLHSYFRGDKFSYTVSLSN